MYPTSRGVFAIIIFAFISMGIVIITPQKEPREETSKKTLHDSFFVSGTDKDTPYYESTGFLKIPIEDVGGDSEYTNTFMSPLLYTIPYLNNIETGSESGVTEIVVALKRYGNKIGEIIRTYTDESRDEVAILKQFVTEPNNQASKDALLALADEYILLSEKLRAVEAPVQIADVHLRYADAHRQIGKHLAMLTTSAFTIENISSYTDSVASFADAYLLIAQTLRAYGVSFGTSEPGDLFTLPF